MIRIVAIAVALVMFTSIVACQRPSSTGEQTKSGNVATIDEHGHEHGDAHEDEGPVIELGSGTIGDWSVRAARDAHPISPGGESPVDVWVTGGSGKPSAVRYWIGVQDASGSVKALASIEDPADQTHWHTHVEIPKPLPEGSKLWIEIENQSGKKIALSFDLKM